MPGRAGFAGSASLRVVGSRKLRRALERFPAELCTELREGFIDIGNEMIEKVGRKLEGNPLNTRSGRLKRSFGKRVIGRVLRDLKLRIFSAGVPYAVWHALRGQDIMRPKRAKYLTIPTKFALTAAGRPKAGMASARQWMNEHAGEWFIAHSKKGNLLIFWKKQLKTKTKIIPLWVLRKSVRIRRGRLGWKMLWRGLASRRKRIYVGAVRAARRRAGL